MCFSWCFAHILLSVACFYILKVLLLSCPLVADTVQLPAMVLFQQHIHKCVRDENQKVMRQNTKKMQKKRVKKSEVAAPATEICRSIGKAMSDAAKEQARGQGWKPTDLLVVIFLFFATAKKE